MKRLLLAAIAFAWPSPAWTGGEWHLATTPTPPPAMVVGGYASGCIAGAQALPLQGEGYRVMRGHRHRYYGHPTTLAVVETLGRMLATEGTMLVGDIAQPRGGPTPYGHHSHQTGLDVDIWYNYLPKGAEIPGNLDEAGEISSLTADYRHLDDARWGEFQQRLVKQAAMDHRVERIFVHPTIKEFFCASDKGAPWLGKLRPWWGHDDHLHLRLFCPSDSPGCKKQAALPPGDGCDASLRWWFTPEAEEEGREILRQDREPTPGPPAPAACLPILTKP